jgi:hypothetical protein
MAHQGHIGVTDDEDGELYTGRGFGNERVDD